MSRGPFPQVSRTKRRYYIKNQEKKMFLLLILSLGD